jgi:tetratricopeptide (TPR) repeat protein
METIKTITNLVIEILQTIKWPGLILILLWKRKMLFEIFEPLSVLIQNMKELKFTIDGKQVTLVPKDIENRIDYIERKARELYPKELEYIPVPYIDSAQLENILGRLQTLEELFNFKLEDIKDEVVIKLIGAYYYLLREFESSKKYYLLAEKQTKTDMGLYAMLGSVCRRLEEYDKALMYFGKSSDIDPDFAWADYGKAVVFKSLNKQIKSKDNFMIAKSKFQKSLTEKNYKYLPYFGLSCIYYYFGDYEKAEDNLNKSIEKRKGFAPAYFNRAAIKIKLEKKEDQIWNDLLIAINLNPKMKEWVVKDSDFDPIRNKKCYQCLIGGDYPTVS